MSTHDPKTCPSCKKNAALWMEASVSLREAHDLGFTPFCNMVVDSLLADNPVEVKVMWLTVAIDMVVPTGLENLAMLSQALGDAGIDGALLATLKSECLQLIAHQVFERAGLVTNQIAEALRVPMHFMVSGDTDASLVAPQSSMMH